MILHLTEARTLIIRLEKENAIFVWRTSLKPDFRKGCRERGIDINDKEVLEALFEKGVIDPEVKLEEFSPENQQYIKSILGNDYTTEQLEAYLNDTILKLRTGKYDFKDEGDRLRILFPHLLDNKIDP